MLWFRLRFRKTLCCLVKMLFQLKTRMSEYDWSMCFVTPKSKQLLMESFQLKYLAEEWCTILSDRFKEALVWFHRSKRCLETSGPTCPSLSIAQTTQGPAMPRNSHLCVHTCTWSKDLAPRQIYDGQQVILYFCFCTHVVCLFLSRASDCKSSFPSGRTKWLNWTECV